MLKDMPNRHLLDEEFGSQQLGFPTTRRPGSYRRQTALVTERDSAASWIKSFPDMELLTNTIDYGMGLWR
jgi:hypothetical protein